MFTKSGLTTEIEPAEAIVDGTTSGGGVATWLALTLIEGVEVRGGTFMVDPTKAAGNAVCCADRDGVPCGAMRVAIYAAGGSNGLIPWMFRGYPASDGTERIASPRRCCAG